MGDKSRHGLYWVDSAGLASFDDEAGWQWDESRFEPGPWVMPLRSWRDGAGGLERLSDDLLRGSPFSDSRPDCVRSSGCDFFGNDRDEVCLCWCGNGEGVVDGRRVIELSGC